MNLLSKIPVNGTLFEQLVAAWGNLTPNAGTTETLEILAPHFQLATLSNGDAETLQQACTVFQPAVNMSYFFSSDYPVECFKPLPQIYAQVG
jgi:hypothetical protein